MKKLLEAATRSTLSRPILGCDTGFRRLAPDHIPKPNHPESQPF